MKKILVALSLTILIAFMTTQANAFDWNTWRTEKFPPCFPFCHNKVTPTPKPTATPTPKPTSTPTPTATPTPVPTSTPVPTATPSPVATQTPTPSVTPTPTPALVKSLCFNYGHQTSTYDLNQVGIDLNVMSSAGIKCIRTSYMGWNNSQSEALANYAKSKGFYVIIGGDWGQLDSSQLASYDSQVLQEAKWANDNHIDQFSLGNEQEYRLSMSKAQWISHLQGLANQVKAIYSGKVSYETSSDFEPDWASAGGGNIDLLGWNAYCGYACNSGRLQKAINDFGKDHVYLSETNADQGTWNSDQEHANEVTNDAVKLESFGVPIYYFTYGTCNNNGVANSWGLYQCGNLAQPLTAKSLGL